MPIFLQCVFDGWAKVSAASSVDDPALPVKIAGVARQDIAATARSVLASCRFLACQRISASISPEQEMTFGETAQLKIYGRKVGGGWRTVEVGSVDWSVKVSVVVVFGAILSRGSQSWLYS